YKASRGFQEQETERIARYRLSITITEQPDIRSKFIYSLLFEYFMKFFLTALLCAGLLLSAFSQRKPKAPAPKPVVDTSQKAKPKNPIAGQPKKYKDVIPDSAISQKGLFTVHKVGDKWFFEIGDSLLNREILAVTRFSKSPAGSRSYGGEEVNEQTIRWEKGPSDVVFMRVVTVVSMAADSSQPI